MAAAYRLGLFAVFQILSLDVSHHDIGRIVLFEDICDLGDVRMI